MHCENKLIFLQPSSYQTPMLDCAGTSWLAFYEFPGPFVFMNEFVTKNPVSLSELFLTVASLVFPKTSDVSSSFLFQLF